MKILIRANARRVFQGMGIYVTIIIMLAFSAIIAFGMTSPAIAVAHYGSETIQVIFVGFSNYIFVPLAAAIFVSGALFTYGAIVNELAYGISRAKIYFSHLLLSSVLCVVLVLVSIACSVLLGTAINGFGSVQQGFWLEKASIFAVLLLLLLALNALATFLVFTTRRTSRTIGAFFAYMIVPRLLVEASAFLNEDLLRFRYFDLPYNIVLMAHLPYLDVSQINVAVALGIGTIVLTTCAGIVLFELRDV